MPTVARNVHRGQTERRDSLDAIAAGVERLTLHGDRWELDLVEAILNDLATDAGRATPEERRANLLELWARAFADEAEGLRLRPASAVRSAPAPAWRDVWQDESESEWEDEQERYRRGDLDLDDEDDEEQERD
jgi:hypothetical protein